MKTKTLVLGLMLIAVIIGSVAIAAPEQGRGPRDGRGGGSREGFRGGPDGPGMGMGGPGMGMGADMTGALLGRLGDRLELTPEQKTEIKTILDGTKADMETMRKASQEALKALHEATEDGTEAEIIAAGKAVGDAFTNEALLKSSVKKQIDVILTDEQKAELAEMKAKMKERMQQQMQQGNRDGRGRGRGQGPGQGQGRRQGRGDKNQN